MNVRALLSNIALVRYKHILAVAFIIAIGYVGWTPALITVDFAVFALQYKGDDSPSVREYLSNEYYNMLDFEEENVVRNKGTYINLHGLIAKTIGQQYMNQRVKLFNGHLSGLNESQDTALAIEQVTKLAEKQREKGKEFIFVFAPSQISKYEHMLPTGFVDYSNQNGDDLIEALKNNGVMVLDLREELNNSGISCTDAFFVTDHHWKPEIGFWAYTKIVDYLIQIGAIDEINTRFTDINEFDVTVYKDWFLGTSGKRTGIYFAGVDDFQIITPRFETKDMNVMIPDWSVDRTGDFVTMAFNINANENNFFSANPYGVYGHGDTPLTHFRNENAPIDMKVLTIGDSFTNVPCVFMPLVFSQCDEMDMRFYSGDFLEYYQEYDPDVLVMLIGASSISRPNTTYDFFSEFDE